MEKFKGTPGPWNVQFGSEVYAGDGVNNAQVAAANDWHDAELIAAAPDLLEALQGLLTRVADDEEYGPEHAITRARAAIAKALGKE